MTYVHAQRTGDTSLLSQHVSPLLYAFCPIKLDPAQYTLLRRWADYLVDNSLAPESHWQ